jgi:hypothetical protein
MQILEELKQIAAKLDKEGIEYALCGGLAMAVYAMPRATLDIDMMIETDSLPRARRAMQDLGFTLIADPMEFHGGKVRIFRLCKIDPGSGEGLALGFLVVTPETQDAWESRRKVEWEGGSLCVVSPQGLAKLKSFRSSGQDRDDIDYLRGITHENED